MSIAAWLRGLWLCWLVGWAGLAAAQQRPVQFEFRHLQERHGLSLNMTSCFLQDRDGFLWIGTYSGLNRYDGNDFIIYKRRSNDDNSLLHNTIHDLCEDHNGNIWVAVESGVSCYNKNTGRFKNIKTVRGRLLGACSNVICDRNGDIWFTSYYAGLYRYVMKTGAIEFFPFNQRDTPQTVSSRIPLQGLLEDPKHNGLWVADKKQGLQYFDIAQQRFGDHPDKHPQLVQYKQHYITALTLDGDRLIFGDATDERVVVYDLRKKQLIKTFSLTSRTGRDVFDLYTIFADRQHNLWMSGSSYVMFFAEANTYRVTEFFHDDGRPTSIGGSLFWAGWQHPDGSVWLGTVNGVSYTNIERSFYDTHNLGAQFPALTGERGIISFAEDADSTWWLGTSIRGLLHYDPKTTQLDVYKLPDGTAEYPYGLPILSVLRLRYGNHLYIGTQNALFKFNTQTKQFTNLRLPAYVTDSKMYLRSFLLHNGQVWMAGDGKRVFCYTIQTQQWQSFPIVSTLEDLKYRVRFSLVDNKGDLWLELYPEGFARFSKQTGQFIVDRLPQGDEYEGSISSFSQDKNGYLWLTTLGQGLLRYDPRQKQYTHWDESDGLVYDQCWAALPDGSGNVWVGAYNKFSVFKPADGSFLNFTLPFNQANLEYNNALFPLRNGHILAALKGYLFEFYPEKLANQSAKLPDKILISHVSIGDSVWLNHRDLASVNLKAEETGFAVHFAALTTNEQAAFQYVYKLDGYEDWKRINEASYAVYTKMPGGDYTFKIKGVAPDGQETPVSSLRIHIDIPFYQTAWFWGLIALIVLGLFIGFLRYRAEQIAQVHTLQVQATRLERDKTEIQYQNLINHLNPHFLFNSLTSLNSLININPREASKFLRKLSLIYRYILQNKDKELVTLEDELTFVQNYIDLQKSRFGDDLQINVNLSPEYLTRQIVPVTIQNLLENAIKHNTLDEENPLIIRIYAEDDALYVANNLQKKSFVETSNKKGLASLRSLYHYLSERDIEVTETKTHFFVKIPLL